MICVLDLYDEWLVYWRVCGSVVIKVENWPYVLGLYCNLVDILPHVKKLLYNVKKMLYVIRNHVIKLDDMY
jgi:hypothetical protein